MVDVVDAVVFVEVAVEVVVELVVLSCLVSPGVRGVESDVEICSVDPAAVDCISNTSWSVEISPGEIDAVSTADSLVATEMNISMC